MARKLGGSIHKPSFLVYGAFLRTAKPPVTILRVVERLKVMNKMSGDRSFTLSHSLCQRQF